MARTNVIMPQMGESIAEGTITKWLKQPGDAVRRDEPLFEISTDKVDAEIPSPTAGVLAEIKVGEGETVEVNTVVAAIADSMDEVGGDGDAPSAAAAPADARPGAAPVATAARPAAPAGDSKQERRQTRSTPLVRRIAEEQGIDISQIQGTGISGRVTKQDLLAYLEQAGPGAAPPAPPAAPQQPTQEVAPSPPTPPPPTPPPAPAPQAVVEAPPAPAPQPAAAAPPAPAAAEPGPEPGAAAAPQAAPDTVPTILPPPPAFEPGENIVIEPMSQMRKKIAEHMVLSKRTSAHVHSVYEIDCTNITRTRQRVQEDFVQRHGQKLTITPFVVKAAVESLRTIPIVNASVDGDNIVYKKDINIGIAVALERGLIVPVIRKADELSLVGINMRVADLAKRARTKELKPDEVQGGTFTITNPGIFGSLFGTPVINQPQVAILGMGMLQKRVMVTKDDALVVRPMMYMCLSYDHRVVDGAVADQFMSHLKNTLETADFEALL
jgi:2-oxoglutarate dehydrogenase E2 component (dihydrolipoamide succinyltransferase)